MSTATRPRRRRRKSVKRREWLFRLHQLAVFVNAHGAWPTGYGDIPEIRLAGWLKAQRRHHLADELSSGRRSYLDAIGEWGSPHLTWDESYERVADYVCAHGRFPTAAADPALGHWLVRQRRRARSMKLSPSKECLLDLLGEWSSPRERDDMWMARLKEAHEFLLDLDRAPAADSDDPFEAASGVWLDAQRADENAAPWRTLALMDLGLSDLTDIDLDPPDWMLSDPVEDQWGLMSSIPGMDRWQ